MVSDKAEGDFVLARKRLSKDFFIYMKGDVPAFFLTVVSQILLVRYLSIEEYGLWGLFFAFEHIMEGVFSSRISYPLSHFFARRIKNQKMIEYLFSINFFSYFLAAVCLFFTIQFSSLHFLPFSISAFLTLLSCARVFLKVLDHPWFSVTQYFKKMPYYSSIEILQHIVFLGISLVLILFDRMSLRNLMIGSLLVYMVQYALKLILIKNFFAKDYNTLSFFSLKSLKGDEECKNMYESYIKTIYISSIFGSVLSNADKIVIASLSGLPDLGYYNLAKTIYDKALRFIRPLGQLIFFEMSKVVSAGDKSILILKFKNFIKKYGFVSLVLLFLAVVFIPKFILFVFGLKYAKSLLPIQILTINLYFMTIFFWVKPALLAFNKEKMYLYIELFSVICFFLLSYFFIPTYGSIGASLIVLTTYVLRFLLMLFTIAIGPKI